MRSKNVSATSGNRAGDNLVLPAVEGVIEGRDMLQGNMGVDFVGYSLQPHRPRATIVFFGGDRCADLAEAGTEDGDAILKFENWVNIVRLLSAKFKGWRRGAESSNGEADGERGEEEEEEGVDVIVVEPSRVEDGVWSCFDTFIPSTRSGEPARGYLREGRGAKHLDSLIQLTLRKVFKNKPRGSPAKTTGESDPAKTTGDGNLAKTTGSEDPAKTAGVWNLVKTGEGDEAAPPPVILVGFSKGGVVLNQLLTEMAVSGDGTEGGEKGLGGREGGFRVAEVHFVDVGLNCRGAYLTDPEAIRGLATKGGGGGRLRVSLHGTPRQWQDKRRTWVAEEKGRMLRLCSERGLQARSKAYFEGQPPSLAMHFHCIEAFDITIGQDSAA